jgi:hypothetical protein
VCLPTAPVLPPGETGNFGTFLICGQLWDKPLIASNNHIGRPDVKHIRGLRICVCAGHNAPTVSAALNYNFKSKIKYAVAAVRPRCPAST